MKPKICITGAGSAQSNGVINSLLMSGDDEEIIGLGSDPADLMLCRAPKRYLMPHSRSPDYKQALLSVLRDEQPGMIHFQHDAELAVALSFKDEIEATGVRMLVPDYDTILTCVHKYSSWERFRDAGLVVPRNIMLLTRDDLERAFAQLREDNGYIWLRSDDIGGGGKGSLPTNDLDEATTWINRSQGWGHFIAAEMLTSRTVTWLSLWKNGELIVAQSRRRHEWAHSGLSRSGVTGVTKIGETCSDPAVDDIGVRAVHAVSAMPNGIYGVDMTYDRNGIPNPTEINISRFFTTIQFFTEAGLNIPKIFKDLVLYDKMPVLSKKLNPLPDGLLWLRAMDSAPLLTTQDEIERTSAEAEAMKMNVAAYVASFLVEKKVAHVFGYQGGAILKLLDEMIATGGISYVQNYHEQASALAADAYSRVTGGIGVALATSGPGATNLITGIANAQLDSIATMFITGQDYTANISANNGARQNGFQDLDIVSVVRPITKYAVTVTDPARIRYEIEKAYWHATSGRPGAVLLDIPIDVQFKDVSVDELPGFVADSASPLPPFDGAPVLRLLRQAQRPVLLIGGGVRIGRAEELVRRFAQQTQVPVIGTVNGLDVVKGTVGFAGLHGHTHANMAIQNADLLIALGVRFGQRQVGKVPSNYTQAKVVHVDIDENELKRIFPDELAIHSDLCTFLEHISAELESVTLPSYAEWAAKIAAWDRRYRGNVYLNGGALDPVQAVERVVALSESDAIFTSDVGQNQMWVAQGFRMRHHGQRLLQSCALGSMGYSLPAAIGAKTAFPDRQVICFTGDGGLQMNLQELQLLGHRWMPVKCVVFNNGTLGMMREVQARYYHGHYYGANREEFACADLCKLADSFGLGYRRIENLAELDSLGTVLTDNMPYIIDLAIPFDSRLSNRYDEAEDFERERLQPEPSLSV